MSTTIIYLFSAAESTGMTPRKAADEFVRRAFTGREIESMSEDGQAIFTLKDGTRRYQVVLQGATITDPAPHYEIWARNDAQFCKSCNAQIVFLTTKRGATIPVNLETVNPKDSIYDPKIHTSHFATCPDAKQFSHKGKRKGGKHA